VDSVLHNEHNMWSNSALLYTFSAVPVNIWLVFI